MKNLKIIIGLLLLFSACSQDPEVLPENQSIDFPDVGDDASNIPQWIYEEMSFFYYWNDELPEQQPTGDEDPNDYFYSLLNGNDSFSYISDDAEAIKEEITGTIVAMGFSPSFGVFTNSDNLFAIVEYVYPNSPAALAGLERGDIILQINGQDLNGSNFSNLLSNQAVELSLGSYNGRSIRNAGETIDIKTGTIELDPVIYDEVIEVDSRKVGYMVYVDFLVGDNDIWLNRLESVLSDFQQSGVDELILDLRYNPGGEIVAAQYLASALAPSGVMASNEVFVKFDYNESLQTFFEERQGENSPNLVTRFRNVDYNLNLSKLYILTTGMTASASELLINGLRPYMDVMVVGEPTFGKFYGSYVLYDQNDPPEHNWAIVPVVLKYSNVNGVSDFANGLNPDVFLQDNLLDARPFGDIDDPFLSVALADITGARIASARISAAKPYTPVYDMNRINLKNTQIFQFR